MNSAESKAVAEESARIRSLVKRESEPAKKIEIRSRELASLDERIRDAVADAVHLDLEIPPQVGGHFTEKSFFTCGLLFFVLGLSIELLLYLGKVPASEGLHRWPTACIAFAFLFIGGVLPGVLQVDLSLRGEVTVRSAGALGLGVLGTAAWIYMF